MMIGYLTVVLRMGTQDGLIAENHSRPGINSHLVFRGVDVVLVNGLETGKSGQGFLMTGGL